jgi:hypothetical protein
MGGLADGSHVDVILKVQLQRQVKDLELAGLRFFGFASESTMPIDIGTRVDENTAVVFS